MSARSGLVGKNPPAPFGAISGIFCMGRKNAKNIKFLPIFLGGPMGPIHPVWGHVLVSLVAAQLLKSPFPETPAPAPVSAGELSSPT